MKKFRIIFFLGKIIVDIKGNEEKIKINMSIDNNFILNVSASFQNNKNKRNKISNFVNLMSNFSNINDLMSSIFTIGFT